MKGTENSTRSWGLMPSSSGNGGAPIPAVAVFILIGKTGVGKSSFIKLLGGKDILTGKEPEVDGGIDSCTTRSIGYQASLGDKEIILFDTPGFDDSAKENMELAHDLVSHLYALALGKVQAPLHGIIFLHDMGEARFSGSQRKTLSILRMIAGSECMGNVIIGTTKWNQASHAKFQQQEKNEQQLLKQHWGGICKSIRLFEGDAGAATRIITDILAKPPVLLQAQREMLQPPHTVESTTVGKSLMPEAQQEYQQLMRELEEQKRQFEEEVRKHGEEAGAREGIEGIEKEIGLMESVFNKVKNPADMSFVEKLGLAIVAPIILAPAALIAAPVGVIAALVHLAQKAGL